MATLERTTSGPFTSAELIDRVMQLRQVVAGLTSDNAELRRELMRLRQANEALQRRLAAMPDPDS